MSVPAPPTKDGCCETSSHRKSIVTWTTCEGNNVSGVGTDSQIAGECGSIESAIDSGCIGCVSKIECSGDGEVLITSDDEVGCSCGSKAVESYCRGTGRNVDSFNSADCQGVDNATFQVKGNRVRGAGSTLESESDVTCRGSSSSTARNTNRCAKSKIVNVRMLSVAVTSQAYRRKQQ